MRMFNAAVKALTVLFVVVVVVPCCTDRMITGTSMGVHPLAISLSVDTTVETMDGWSEISDEDPKVRRGALFTYVSTNDGQAGSWRTAIYRLPWFGADSEVRQTLRKLRKEQKEERRKKRKMTVEDLESNQKLVRQRLVVLHDKFVERCLQQGPNASFRRLIEERNSVRREAGPELRRLEPRLTRKPWRCSTHGGERHVKYR